MQIAIDGRYVQDHFPGIARYTYNLVSNLADLVEDEVIVYHNPSLVNTRYHIEELQRQGKVRLCRFDVPTFSALEQWRLPLRLLSDRVEVFHSPYYLKPYVQRAKSVVTIYDVISCVYPQYMPSLLARTAFEITTRLALASAKIIITLSESSKKDLISRYKVNADRIAVTYLAADSRFQPRERSQVEHIRERYRLPSRFVLYVGINKPHKNLVKLVEAFSMLEADKDVYLVIAGKEDKRYPQARSAAENCRAKERIVFLSNVREDDLPFIYNLADIFVFPSLYEGFGLPPLEAMSSGLPVVCSDRSSLPEVVGDAGMLVNPEDAQEMSEAMARVLGDTTLQDRMRANSLQRAKDFSWLKTAQQTLELYKKATQC